MVDDGDQRLSCTICSLSLSLSSGLFVRRRSDLPAADGVPGPNRPAVGVELGEEQGEGQALLSGPHRER